ncbi:MAG: aminotransferase class I/II-fold pyridoxal phosphate-dependent enzyme [Actinomycetota bacterium]|nr:aminotransferase class I/II-fold pyridoxal phosphate-dependent enzyme [Actinomycetota bacterium]
MSTPTYTGPILSHDVELDLSRNEGMPASTNLVGSVVDPNELIRRYPDTTDLSRRLAEMHSVPTDQVLVTAGGDDALFRCILSRLGPGRTGVATTPTFEMIPIYAAQVGSRLVEVDWWDGPFPTVDVVTAARDADVVFVVSPNNPTGATVTLDELRTIAGTAELVVLDAAYAEFADEDLTAAALDLGNTVVVRTLSKAYGLAGLRIGYLLGPPDLIAEMASYGSPYSVSSLSAAVALERLDRLDDLEGFVNEVRSERAHLTDLLESGEIPSLPSQGNFVLASVNDPSWIVGACGSLGVGLRQFTGRGALDGWIRITLPGDPDGFAQLQRVLSTALAPEAILFDLDGVLVDVGDSYRRSIIETAASFGASVTEQDIEDAKAAGGANDDWELAYRLIAERGGKVRYGDVVERFEEIYQGSPGRAGLKLAERALVDPSTWRRWADVLPIGIVTGRPRKDAEEALDRFGLLADTSVVVTREDGPLKPDPEPVRLAMERLCVDRSWFIGDTPDDVEAARSAGAVPIGVVAPGTDPQRAARALSQAARVLNRTIDLEELLP